MRTIDTVIVGGGQAGLAMSRSLTQRGVEHVVLERGEVGERWRSERWASLRLLTPRWLSRLSGQDCDGDPKGFMTRREVIDYLEHFAYAARAPVLTGAAVTDVTLDADLYRVETGRGPWMCKNVVIATGQSQAARVPDMAAGLTGRVEQVVPTRYRDPHQLRPGGVLVVGASATGAKLAAEIHASGRPVTLAVGRHTRLPRSYRGVDIMEWLARMGILDQQSGDVRNLAASRSQPSMQLTGSSDHRSLDLNVLQRQGVRLVGRAAAALGERVAFMDDLVETVAAAEFKLAGLRVRIDRHIDRCGGSGSRATPPEPFDPVAVQDGPTLLDLRREGIHTVLWATGFTRSYPWLRVPVLDAGGEIQHVQGVTRSPGLYVLGLNFMRTRISSFIGGVGRDADCIADHLVHLRSAASRSPAHLSHRAVA